MKEASVPFYKKTWFHLLVLIVIGSFFLFFKLGERALFDPDEGRYAEIAREMYESGDWITPRLNEVKHFDKPPFTYWLAATSYSIFGVNEFAARLPSALAGIGGIIVIYLLGRCLFNSTVGLLAALILLSSLEYFIIAHLIITDMLLCFFVLLSYLFFCRGCLQKNRKVVFYLFFYITLALGMITKGPVVLVFTLLPILFYIVLFEEWAILKEMKLLLGLLIFVAISAPWFIIVSIKNKGLSEYFINYQFIQRITTTVHQRRAPFYFYIYVLCGGFFPWIFFIPNAIVRYLARKTAKSSTGILNRPYLLFLWFLIPFVFLSIVKSKLPTYILPLYPPIALFIANLFFENISSTKPYEKTFSISFFFLIAGLIAVIASSVFMYKIYPKFAFLQTGANYLAIILSAGVIISIFFYFRRNKALLFGIIAFTMLIAFLFSIWFVPKFQDNIPTRIKGKLFAEKIKPHLKPDDHVVCFGLFYPSLPFYLQTKVVIIGYGRYKELKMEEEYEGLIFKDPAVLSRFLAARTGIFCITSERIYETIRDYLPENYYILERVGDDLLLTNVGSENR